MESIPLPTWRLLERADFPLLSRWFALPHVEPWWCEPSDLASIEERYGPSIDGNDATEVFLIVSDDEPIGLIQRYLIDDNPDWKKALSIAPVPSSGCAGIDYLIGSIDMVGHGLGPRIIDAFVKETWGRYKTISTIVVSCQQANRRSWRTLEKAGFHRVWAGFLESTDPSDQGFSYVYIHERQKN